ncbi:MAG: hypothetical protein KAT11_08015, partial [Phycisphaerae bacterium]|nr:hypothetical protein [Phycisphaerae bacterium]
TGSTMMWYLAGIITLESFLKTAIDSILLQCQIRITAYWLLVISHLLLVIFTEQLGGCVNK